MTWRRRVRPKLRIAMRLVAACAALASARLACPADPAAPTSNPPPSIAASFVPTTTASESKPAPPAAVEADDAPRKVEAAAPASAYFRCVDVAHRSIMGAVAWSDSGDRFEGDATGVVGIPQSTGRVVFVHEDFLPTTASSRQGGPDERNPETIVLEAGHRLEGIVVDQMRRPLRGAEATLSSVMRPIYGPPAQAGYSPGRNGAPGSYVKAATTRDDGTFAMSGLRSGAHYVGATLEGYLVVRESLPFPLSIPTATPCEIMLSPAFTARYLVEARSSCGRNHGLFGAYGSAVTPVDASLRHMDSHSDAAHVAASKHLIRVDVVAKPGASPPDESTLRVTVRDLHDVRSVATIKLRRSTDPLALEVQRVEHVVRCPGCAEVVVATTLEIELARGEGHFAFTFQPSRASADLKEFDVPSGRYRVRLPAFGIELPKALTEEFVVAPGERKSIRLEGVDSAAACSVVIAVVDEAGAPVPGFRAMLRSRSARGSKPIVGDPDGLRTWSGPKGDYSINVVSADGVTIGSADFTLKDPSTVAELVVRTRR
jgi:hypothetical protein